VRARARAERRRAARGGVGGGRPGWACARAVPDGGASPLLRAVRRAVRAPRDPQLRRDRERPPPGWLPHALALPRPAAAEAGEARRAAAHVAGGARGGLRGRTRTRRAEAPPPRPAAPRRRSRLERPRRAAPRRGPRAARRRAALVRARDRRRGAGSLADAAPRDLAPRGRRLAHDPRRRRAGDRPGRLPPLGGARAVPA